MSTFPRPLESVYPFSGLSANYVTVPRPRVLRWTPTLVSPAFAFVNHAEERNERNSHENLGFLSVDRGFLPRTDPRSALPPEFRAWDQIAAELPQLYASLTVRERIAELPLLDASKPNLPDQDVLRAAALLAILAHAYWYSKPTVPTGLPEVISKPWAQVRARLGRRQEALTYIDLIVYNWQRKDPKGPFTVENLRLLFPTIGNEEEQIFYLTQLEILARCTDVVQTMLAAQNAVLNGNAYRVETALCTLSHQLDGILRTSLPKINPHGHSHTYVDAVTWAKTVAPFAVPIHQGDLGPSGTSSPIFNALDIFLGRKQYASFLGKEIQQLRTVYPPFWRAFMLALSRVNLSGYVANSKNSSLQEAYKLANEAYAGETGFLGRHRMKVYGFLELAFKVGRSVTIGGFGGAFKDRTWDQVDAELTRARVERPSGTASELPRAHVAHVPGTRSANSTLHRLRFTVEGGHRVHFQPGDHVQVWPSHPDSLVERTLRASGATGDEPLALTPEWEHNLALRGEASASPTFRQLLRYASLRSTSHQTAKALLAFHSDAWLKQTLDSERLSTLELWQVFEHLGSGNYPLARLLESPQTLAAILTPEPPRTYSIASAAPRSVLGTNTFDLAVRLHTHNGGEGVASSFLCRAPEHNLNVPFSIQKAAAFGPPPDPNTPVIGFAAGSGVAPMLSLFAERLRHPRTRNWLILSLTRTDDFQFSQDWHDAVTSGALRLDVVFTRQGAKLQHCPQEGFSFAPSVHRHVQDLLGTPDLTEELHQWLSGAPDSLPAHVYICGTGGFANTAMGCIEKVIGEQSEGADTERYETGRQAIFRMTGERRLTIEAHTDATPAEEDGIFTPADVAAHNCPEYGYWITVDDVVYDLTEFRSLHPGGARIVDAYAGMDATHGFKRAHHGRADITAQLATYRRGRLYSPRFDPRTIEVESPLGRRQVNHAGVYRAYVSALNLCTEMENALRIDLSLSEQTVHPHQTRTTLSPYVWARQAETHHRFLATYVSVLSGDTLPNLDAIAHALYGNGDDVPETSSAPASSEQDVALPSPEQLFERNLNAAATLVAEVSDAGQAVAHTSRIRRLTALDVALIEDVKRLLRRAVNAIAYRDNAQEPTAAHPAIVLNVQFRARLDEYLRAVAGECRHLDVRLVRDSSSNR
jgi:sulfite reductase alpha subunit-like flavoprotein